MCTMSVITRLKLTRATQLTLAHHDSPFCMLADGRLLQSHKKLQELSDLRGIDYLRSDGLYPEIGPELAGLDALKTQINAVTCLTHYSLAAVGSASPMLPQCWALPAWIRPRAQVVALGTCKWLRGLIVHIPILCRLSGCKAWAQPFCTDRINKDSISHTTDRILCFPLRIVKL